MMVRPTTIAAKTSTAQMIPDNHALVLVLTIACLPAESCARILLFAQMSPTATNGADDTIALRLLQKGGPNAEISDDTCDLHPPGRRRRRWCESPERFGDLRSSLSGKFR